MTRQLGMSLRQVPFSQDLLNPWLLPVVVELSDGQVAVIEKADSEGNISIQFSGLQIAEKNTGEQFAGHSFVFLCL